MPSITFETPTLGIDEDAHPRVIQRNRSVRVKNFLTHKPGILDVRGALSEAASWSDAGNPLRVQGIWYFNDSLLISRIALSGTAVRDPWVAPYRPTGNVNDLRDLDLTMVHINFDTGVVTNVAAANANGVIGIKSIRVGNSVYGIGGDSTSTSAGAPGTIYKLNQLLRWDGGTLAPTLYGANAPLALQDITYHHNRLFALGSVSANNNRLYYSDPLPSDGTTLPVNITAWQDDVSGLENIIVVGAADDTCVAMARVGQNLAIFKRRHIYMLYGSTPQNWTMKAVANEVGCIDPRSVVESGTGVFFMSDRGFMYFDGVDVRNVSYGVQSTLVANARARVGDNGVDGGFCRAWNMGNNYIAVQTGVLNGTTGDVTNDTDVYLYHIPTGAWTTFSSTALDVIHAGGHTVNDTYILGNTTLVRANYITDPDNQPDGTAMYDTIDGDVTRQLIPAEWITRTQIVDSPLTQAQLQRVVMDYEFGPTGTTRAWDVDVIGHAYDGSQSSSGAMGRPDPDPGQAKLNLRASYDLHQETDEVHLEVDWTATNLLRPTVYDFNQIHGAYVEYMPTRRTRNLSY